jgi:hypothetical protein
MLRIDESSKTLVAPQEAAFVAEAAPARDELLALVSSGWQAFSAEIGQSHLKYLASAPEPGVEVLAFDEAAGRVAIVQVSEDPRAGLTTALIAAAEVAHWDAQDLAEVHESLQAAVPGDSPRIVLVGAHWDEQTVATMDWLVRRHGLEISAYQVHMLRFGSERLMNVSRAYPNAEAPLAAPSDPAAFFAQVGSAAPQMAGVPSSPPPGVPAM